ncbi:MAG TPA: ribonuclease H-like domain-containing protein [Clostridiales bacterium]|nr:ribonuclease H-like domain-containing protein [Clostridiales bacterium]
MITRQFTLQQGPAYPFEREYDLNKILYFDIETTGFSAESTYLYLIGCAYYRDSSFHILQWFSEDIREEGELLAAFFEFLRSYEVLVHYNGTGFDIPYLQRKIKLLGLDYSFDHVVSLDIYKRLTPYKKLFQLKNFKLKTIEKFLGIRRQDMLDGGDLIQVYQSYLGKKHYEELWKKRNPGLSLPALSEAEQLLQLLLLHNSDDIQGLVRLSPILYYADLFEKPIRIQETYIRDREFVICFEITADLPVRITYGNGFAHLDAFGNTANLTISVYEGELKYFYSNYKDYYYLPAEDYAIHKSIASYVDKDYRKKATPSNCYTRKQGIFAPQHEPLITPCFKMNHADKLSFLEIHTDFLLQEENLERYVVHMLQNLLSS